MRSFVTLLLVFHIITSWIKEKNYVSQRTSRSEKEDTSRKIRYLVACSLLHFRLLPGEEGRWQKYKYGEAWQIDYITLPRSCNGKRYVLTMVKATTRWLETYAVPHATARNTILGLEKQVLWRHGTPERIESDNGTHFKNTLIKT